MNKKVIKIAQIVAVIIFVTALGVNISVTLTDPFIIMSNEAVATTSASSSSSGTFVPECGDLMEVLTHSTLGVCDDDSHGHSNFVFVERKGTLYQCVMSFTRDGECNTTFKYTVQDCITGLPTEVTGVDEQYYLCFGAY